MDRPIRWHDYITININWFALTARSQVLTPLLIPLLVQQFVGDEAKGAYVGIIRLWALMFAVLMQAFMGMVSDASRLPWGRRRPFIFIGTLGEIVIFMLIGLAAGLEGLTGFWVLFALYVLSMLSANTSHAATQGLIPDLVPDSKKGAFAGVKALLELPVPLIFVSFVIGRQAARGDLWGALFTLSAAMLIGMGIAMFAPEKKLPGPAARLEWRPLGRLLGMTLAFTAIILTTGWIVRQFTAAALAVAPGVSLWLVGALGLAGMAAASILGVWASLRVGFGREFQANRSFTWWVINRLVALVALTNLASFLVFFLQERFPDLAGEKAAGPAANVVLFVGVFILLTALPSGWLADKFGKKPLIAASSLLAALGTFLVILAPGMTVVYVGGCLVGAGTGLFYSANWALGTEIVPPKRAGEYLGMSNLAGAGAGAVGAYIGGPIADQTSYVLLMGIYAFLLLLALLPLAAIQERKNGRSPEGVG
ncbi:MAG TPA: MFS transporter [Anaerolineales bacterium]|nr:MFS transporter [Anaerolineales bacterium]